MFFSCEVGSGRCTCVPVSDFLVFYKREGVLLFCLLNCSSWMGDSIKGSQSPFHYLFLFFFIFSFCPYFFRHYCFLSVCLSLFLFSFSLSSSYKVVIKRVCFLTIWLSLHLPDMCFIWRRWDDSGWRGLTFTTNHKCVLCYFLSLLYNGMNAQCLRTRKKKFLEVYLQQIGKYYLKVWSMPFVR